MSDELAAVVLAAGKGTRLRPLTDLLPKALCPVKNVALVDTALAQARAVTTHVAVNVHSGRDAMVEHLEGRVHLSIEEPEPLGTAGALGALRDWIGGRDVLVVNADRWHPEDLAAFADGWDRAHVRMLVVPSAVRADFGMWRHTGVCLLPWADVSGLEPVPSGLYEEVWAGHAARDELELIPSTQPFFDCGTPADYLRANMRASGGTTVIGDGAVVRGTAERSVLWRHTTVEPGEHLVDAIRARDDVTLYPLA